MSRLYGAFINLEARRCLVVGGGPVAERKITGLLDCGAKVTVIAPDLTAPLALWAEAGRIEWESRHYRTGDVGPFFLIFAATSSRDVNALICEEAERAGKLCNVVNDGGRGHFLVPSMIRRGRLQIAVSTEGASPGVAKRIREELEGHFGDEYEQYLEWMATIRSALRHTVEEEAMRTQILRNIASSDLLSLLREQRHDDAKRLIADLMGGQL